MSRRDTLKGIFGDAVEELAMANFDEAERSGRDPAGPVRTMALTLGKMEAEAKAMQEALIMGLRIQDLATDLIDDSFVRDRIGALTPAEDDPLVRSIAENGQESPILVRPHPEQQGRYQVAYGHRRLRAARLLGIPVKAVVREINDEELVVAQGVENTARSDLTWIEKATFSHTLEERGFKRPLIMKALTTDKTELSKMISVAAAIPASVITQIGNAPAFGRRKWTSFAEAFSSDKLPGLEALFTSKAFGGASSDQRFDLALKQMQGSKAASARRTWKPEQGGRLSVDIKADGKGCTLALKAAEAPAFGEFLTSKLDELYAEFKRTGD